jgi:hypothetical protein
MANKRKEKTYWPYMIVGFLMVGITLSYWTVKSASSIPVQESNNYMMKYQQADININEILKRKALFDSQYKIKLVDAKKAILELENTKRAKSEEVIVLTKGNNSFSYIIENVQDVSKVKVTFLLTRPHSRSEDFLIDNVLFEKGKYIVSNLSVQKAGRYILQLKVKIGDAIGYSEIPAYLKP